TLASSARLPSALRIRLSATLEKSERGRRAGLAGGAAGARPSLGVLGGGAPRARAPRGRPPPLRDWRARPPHQACAPTSVSPLSRGFCSLPSVSARRRAVTGRGGRGGAAGPRGA